MSLPATTSNPTAFVRQAHNCRAAGSPFVAEILEAADRQLAHAPITSAIVRSWTGDTAAAAVALRVNGALHALARRGRPERLAALYRAEHDDFDGAVAEALSLEDQFIADWIRFPTQTNEVARGAAVMSALMTVAAERPLPFQILELGSSCGLNLNLTRYAYKLGAVSVGDPASAVRIEPQWRGADPPKAPVSILSARGVDVSPLSAARPADRERLLSYTWADQPSRAHRLEQALLTAISHPPLVDRNDAVHWLADRLAEPQPAGLCRAVVHTMFLQYLSDADRLEIANALADAGASATAERPLVEVGFEWTTDRREVQLRLTRWPDGETTVLAKCHPYGDWVEWHGDRSQPQGQAQKRSAA